MVDIMPLFSRIPFAKQQIEDAIAHLESQTSAELRVYIERYMSDCDEGCSVVERALRVFEQLEMHATQARNGVLIYIAYKDHRCAVIGDSGIHQYVGEDFWQQQCTLMTADFKQHRYTDGVVHCIRRIAEKLAAHFPIQPDDSNELDNEVIIHD